MGKYRAFGGVADGRWFPGSQSIVVPTETPPSSDVLWLDTERYVLQTWAYHDVRLCSVDWRVAVLHRGCLWRGRAWVREDDHDTMEQITRSLNALVAVVGLCHGGMA